MSGRPCLFSRNCLVGRFFGEGEDGLISCNQLHGKELTALAECVTLAVT
jgi:hypothetical protein